jgi:hypothetical protein
MRELMSPSLGTALNSSELEFSWESASGNLVF